MLVSRVVDRVALHVTVALGFRVRDSLGGSDRKVLRHCGVWGKATSMVASDEAMLIVEVEVVELS